MSFTGRPVDKISCFLLFIVTNGGRFVSYALENSARLSKIGVGAYILQIPLSYKKPRQTLLTEGWSRNHSFEPYYNYIVYKENNVCTQ